MRCPGRFMLAFVCLLLAAPVWAQVPVNPVYVSGGPFIYQVTAGGLVKVYDATIGGAPLTDSAYAGPYFSSLAIGPDGVNKDAHGNALYPFLVYACDDKTNTIIRFAPGGAVTSSNPPHEQVGTTSFPPACGRSTSTGDFYVTDESGGSGTTVYRFAGVANASFPSGWASTSPTPVALSGSGAVNAGITQKNVGDLLLVDHTNNQVLRSPYGPPFSRVSAYISSNLSSPVGIARISAGDVFVGNQGSSNVAHFSGNGALAGTCPSLTFPGGATNTVIHFLAADETDTIYVAASDSSDDAPEDLDFSSETDNPGQVWSWSPGQTCVLQSVAPSETELFGVAVAPIPTAAITETLSSPSLPTNPTPTAFNFNSTEFKITANGCTATVTAYQLSLANINSMIGLAKLAATPAVNLGEGGYEIAYVAEWADAGCTSVFTSGPFAGTFPTTIFGLYDSNLVTNPRMIRCDSSPQDDANEPFLDGSNSCTSLTAIGAYPIGPIPTDGGFTGGGRTNSVFFLVNANQAAGGAGGGSFCPELPLNNTTVDTDDFLSIAFQVAQTGGNCETGPFVPNAQAILSVAQIKDANGNPSFVPIFTVNTLFNQGSNFVQPPLCKFFPHSEIACTYALVLNVAGSHLTPGTYELGVLFLTNNAPEQSITFKVVAEGTPGTF